MQLSKWTTVKSVVFFFPASQPYHFQTSQEQRTKIIIWNYVTKKSDPQNKASKCFLFHDHYIDSHNLSTWLCINVVRRKLMLVTDLRVDKLEALLVCGLLERKYYWWDSRRFWIPRHRFRILSVGFRILCQLNWDSGFQSKVGGIP